jgi:hypothetical protein
MRVSMIVSVAGLLAALPVTAGELKPEEARRFVAGKLFAYNCFDGTTGVGRISADGSVAGTIRTEGKGSVTHMMLPAGTLKVKDEAVCASLKGLPWEPCFNLVQTDGNSFRASIRGLDFAYCTFTRRNPGMSVVGTKPLPLGLRTAGSK